MLIDLGAHGFVVFVGCLSWVRAVYHSQLHQLPLKTHLSGQPLTHPTNSQDMIYFWWRANKLLYTRPWREAIDEIKVLRTTMHFPPFLLVRHAHTIHSRRN